ncbi:MAG TPA: TIGR01777 family oxidoreductase, partial [Planctomycetota bacterium]|nr:TIGR01777 family oxidoreductase [Planctomycetota bacterium]
MTQVEFTTPLPVSAADAFAWHARPGALRRLLPPWQDVRVLSEQPAPGAVSIVEDGGQVELSLAMGPVRRRWVARHQDCRPGESFKDVMEHGPLTRWAHHHAFTATADGCVLSDRVDYELGFPAALVAGGVQRDLQRLFAFRHARTRADLERHAAYPTMPLTIAITGAGGLVGSALVPFLTTGGHRVRTIGRGAADIRWDPARGILDAQALEGVDAVIHLAGENVAQRWSPAAKAGIRDSRVQSTTLIARFIAVLRKPPRVLVMASGVGAYGTHADDAKRSEDAAYGSDFLAGVCRDWETSADPACLAGIRVVQVRIGMVVSAAGGALAKMLPAFRISLGGPIGSGNQWQSWIHRDDLIDVLHRAVMDDRLSGAVNAVAPQTLR